MLKGAVLQFYSALKNTFNDNTHTWQDPARIKFEEAFDRELNCIDTLTKICGELDDKVN